jgi:hypothetical protein
MLKDGLNIEEHPPTPPPGGPSTRFWVMASPYGASRSHPLDTPHLVGFLYTSDQPDAQAST